MKTKKNNRKKKSLNNPKVKNQSRRKNKKLKKISRKFKFNQQGGTNFNQEAKVGKFVIINDTVFKYRGLKAELLEYDTNKKAYKCRILNLPYNNVFSETLFLTEDQFNLEVDTIIGKEISSPNKKIYVLWVVNCDSCKLSTIPYCSSNGIYDTYNYYNSLNNFYSRFNTHLRRQLELKFYCSILLRAQETAKIITKGIKDSLPELYKNINQKGITIMNYCQEIQRFKTSFKNVQENAFLLNNLIPDTLSIDSSNIIGIDNSSPDISIKDESAKIPEKQQISSELNEQPDALKNESTKIAEEQQIPSELNEQPDVLKSESPIIPEKQQISSELNEKSDVLESESPNSLEFPVINLETQLPETDSSLKPDTEKIEVQLPNNISNEQLVNEQSDKPKGNSFLSFFGNFGKGSDKNNPKSIDNGDQNSLSETEMSNTQNGGFFNFMNSLFANSSNKGEQVESQQIPKINFRTQKNDYQNWKEMVLPVLNDKHLNIVISHGYYIKRYVLNNNSRTRATNLDTFLLEYNFNNNQLTKINLLDENFKEIEISSQTSNKEINATFNNHPKKTSNLWNEITKGSTIKQKEQYSRCFIK